MRLVHAVVLGALCPLANAQTIFPVAASYDYISREVLDTVDCAATDAATVNVTSHRLTAPVPGSNQRPCGPNPLYDEASLGLSPFGTGFDVDAITTSQDYYPPGSVNTPNREVTVEFSLGRGDGSIGQTAHPIVQTQYGGNGAASDTFSTLFTPGVTQGVLSLGSDHQGLTPQGGLDPETNIDALLDGTFATWPVYFSLTTQTAATVGLSGADILVMRGPNGPLEVYWPHYRLGLNLLDDIDALCMSYDRPGGDWEVVFSLAAGSPTLTGSSPPVEPPWTSPIPLAATLPAPLSPLEDGAIDAALLSIGPSGLAYAAYRPGSIGWTSSAYATPAQLGLGLVGDVDLVAAWIHDPFVDALGSSNKLFPGWPGTGEADQLRTLLIDGVGGGRDNRMLVGGGQSYDSRITLTAPAKDVTPGEEAYYVLIATVHEMSLGALGFWGNLPYYADFLALLTPWIDPAPSTYVLAPGTWPFGIFPQGPTTPVDISVNLTVLPPNFPLVLQAYFIADTGGKVLGTFSNAVEFRNWL